MNSTILREKYIISGYRETGCGWHLVDETLFTLNNELVNAWTHIIAAIAFFVQAVLLGNRNEGEFTALLYAAFTVAMVSALAHIFNACSHVAYHVMFLLDNTTIVIFIYVAAVCIAVYTTGCKDNSLYLGLCFFFGVVGLLTASAVRLMNWPTAIRALAYAPYPLCVFWPLLTRLFTYYSYTNKGYVAFVFVQTLAVLFYVTYFPEICFPVTFDILGSSHQWFHVLEVVAMEIFIYSIYKDAECYCNGGGGGDSLVAISLFVLVSGIIFLTGWISIYNSET